MTDSAANLRLRHPYIARLYRLQWEEVQQAHVLLFPEGMIKLNGSAGEILRRCDGQRSAAEIIGELETAFGTTGLGSDVDAFLKFATEKGWVEWIDA
jgi:pyrroloquinoline quinone biosynthesis protein D